MANEVKIKVTAQDESGPEMDKAEAKVSKLKSSVKAAGSAIAAGGAVAGGLFAKGLADNMDIQAGRAKLAGQLGLSKADSERIGKVAGAAYADNWGNSMDEVNDAIKAVSNNMASLGETSSKDLQGMTEDALALASTFDVDVNDSTRAAGQLMTTGLAKNSTEAFDIITTGLQNGLDKSGDFLDTLNEYSPQFSKLGISGKEMAGILHAGLSAGARDTDAVADAFKELSIRVVDGSTTTASGFKAIGLNAKDMAEQFGKGGQSAHDATQKVIDGLLAIKDPVKQNIAGTQLFGTQWEDTVRKILPNLADFKDGAMEVDGATKTMSNTVGDTAAGKIETMKRKFEQWTQSMSNSDSEIGTLVTGVQQFGGGAMTAASQAATLVIALKGINLAMMANPIGITIGLIVALGVAFAVLWEKSTKFRNIVMEVFDDLTHSVMAFAKIALLTFKMLVDTWMNAADAFLTGSVKAFGWIPGVGGKLKAAQKSFDSFKNGVNGVFDSAIKKTEDWTDSVDKMKKTVKLQGNIQDLQDKLNKAKAQLKTVPASKKAALLANIADLQNKVNIAKAALASVKSKTVTITTVNLGRAGPTKSNIPINRHGGIIGAATGGARGGLTWVGEDGPELAQLPYGTTVYPSGQSNNMAAQAAGGGEPIVLELHSSGTDIDNFLLQILRKAIRVRGGKVQVVLGT